MDKDDSELVSIITLNKLSLKDNVLSNLSESIEENLQTENAACFYHLVKRFNLKSLVVTVFEYVARCFTILVETPSFLELDFTLVSKILASSELLITTELEVLNAANAWLSYNTEERKKFAKDLLLKVRLPLLSDHALKHISNESSCFTKIVECVNLLKQVSDYKDNFYRYKSSISCTRRYCNQKLFNILICGGYSLVHEYGTTSNVKQVSASNLKIVDDLTSMTNKRESSKAVYLKGEVYVLGGHDRNGNWINSVEKYSASTNTWKKVADMYDDRIDYCICAFMDKIFVIAGIISTSFKIDNPCLQFDTKGCDWKEVAKLNESRFRSACGVFEGRIVVSGGTVNCLDNLRTVESYDVITDKWSPMPDMINGKIRPDLVVVKNKLFVIANGIDTCEVFDSICKKFVALKSPEINVYCLQAFAIRNKIYVFQNYGAAVKCYDVDEDKWSDEACEVTKNVRSFSCVKVPRF